MNTKNYKQGKIITEIDDKLKQQLKDLINNIYDDIKGKFKKNTKFYDVISNNDRYNSSDLIDNQLPEEFAKRYIIEPLLNFLSYEITPATTTGGKKPDYTITSKFDKNLKILVEAEPINTDLHSKNKGIDQVKNWLKLKSSGDYGIATDGLKWIFLKYNNENGDIVILNESNLGIILKNLKAKMFFDKDNINDEEINKFLMFHSKYISFLIKGYISELEEQKEEISKQFYNDYVKFVFGYDTNGEPTNLPSLMNSIICPKNKEYLKGPFCTLLMNRLIFIKFLEEKNIVSKNLIDQLWEKFKILKQSNDIYSNFYDSYLIPLFYKVFNTQPENRLDNIKQNDLLKNIPYLNGGLFRNNFEEGFSVNDDGIELVIDNLISSKKYFANDEKELKPEILGYIFEKTINYISGTGSDKRKIEGAYYTPDDVVKFIIENTLYPKLYEVFINTLRNEGWKDIDLEPFTNLNDILDNVIDMNPKYIKKLKDSLKSIKILDPACGSGHFLTEILNELVRIEELLSINSKEKLNRFQIKKEIISNNIFGIDIDENAVEITQLRLWLSLISEVKNNEEIETLPNIEFNIITGNTLVGWLDEKLASSSINIFNNEDLIGNLDIIQSKYPEKVIEIKRLLQSHKITDLLHVYDELRKIYSIESGELNIQLKEILLTIKNNVYKIIDESYNAYLHSKSGQKIKLNKNRILHLGVDFRDILDTGGFDIIIGNPPYIEDENYEKSDLNIIKLLLQRKKGKKKYDLLPFLYYSKDSGNTYAYFLERSLKLLKENGYLGFILPISIISTDRMKSIREYVHSNSSMVIYYNFDDRPGKLFYEGDHGKNTILILKKGLTKNEVFTTKCIRWNSEDRLDLFKTIKKVKVNLINDKDILFFDNIIPKISDEIEYEILKKLYKKSNGKIIGNYILNDNCKNIFFYDTCRYFIHVHTEENKNAIGGSQYYEPLCIDERYYKIIIALLNSTLFYWWFRVWSDERHVLRIQIEYFPINLEIFNNKIDEINKLTESLMNSYYKNANIRRNKRKGGYTLQFREIRPIKSKDILNEIDNLILDILELNPTEKNFIINYDSNFRFKDEEIGDDNL